MWLSLFAVGTLFVVVAGLVLAAMYEVVFIDPGKWPGDDRTAFAPNTQHITREDFNPFRSPRAG